MVPQGLRYLGQRNSTLAQIALDRIAWPHRAGLLPHSPEGYPLALVGQGWGWAPGGHGSIVILLATMQAAAPAAVPAIPRALINVDGQAGYTTLVPPGRAPRAQGADFVAGSRGEDNATLIQRAHGLGPPHARPHP
jgi:hypothetical protein